MRRQQPEEEKAREPGGQEAEAEGAVDAEATGEVNELERDEAELQAVAEERDQLFERLQRVTAELENYRKRVQREREDWRQFALEGFLKDLLSTIDNFERAREAARESGDLESLLEGLELIDRELQRLLGRHRVEPIDALGRPFDPFEHEAVETEPAGDETPGTVTAVLQRGYRLHDRVLRPVRVRVAQRPESQSGESGEQKPSPKKGTELDMG